MSDDTSKQEAAEPPVKTYEVGVCLGTYRVTVDGIDEEDAMDQAWQEFYNAYPDVMSGASFEVREVEA